MARKSGFETKRDHLLNELDHAAKAGQWLPWAGFGSAVVWWGAASGAALAIFGASALLSGPPLIVVSASMMVFLPGFLMIMAGLMARQSVRSAGANALVLKAAGQLLSPSREVSRDTETLVETMRQNIETLNAAMVKTVEVMKRVSGDVDAERLKIESVSYAAADNARDLTERLSREREALEGLTRSLKEQVEVMGEVIPQQARLMAEAAGSATQDVAAADQTLQNRLAAMEQTTRRLVENMNGMRAFTDTAFEQTHQVQAAVDAIEKKLNRSQDLVRNAEAAGSMAADAVADAGRRLDEAVTSALAGTRQLADEMARRSDEAQKAAMDVLERLEQTRLEQDALIAAAAEAPPPIPEPQEPFDEPEAETVTNVVPVHFIGDDEEDEADDQLFDAEPDEVAEITEAIADMAEADNAPDPQHIKPSLGMTPPVQSPFDQPVSDMAAAEIFETPAERTEDTEETTGLFEAPAPTRPLREKPRLVQDTSSRDTFGFKENPQDPINRDVGWSSILADMEEPLKRSADDAGEPSEPKPADVVPSPSFVEPAEIVEAELVTAETEESKEVPPPSFEPQPDPGREEQVRDLVGRLTGSGIRLGEIFKARDKRKIASAADRGDDGRREAVRKCARREIERLEARLRNDPDLHRTATWFFRSEADSAIDALMTTRRSNRNASPELAAFLLIDAAIGGGAGSPH